MVQQRLYDFSKAGVGLLKLRQRLGEGSVSDNAAARIYMGSVNAARRKCGSGNPAGDTLSEPGNVVSSARRKFAHGYDAAQQVVQSVELFFKLRMNLDKPACAQQIRGGIEVPLTGSAREFQRLLAVACTGGGGHSQKLIGHFGQRADYHNRMLGKTPTHDGRNAVNGFSILHRGAAKFHYDHGCTIGVIDFNDGVFFLVRSAPKAGAARKTAAARKKMLC